MRKNFTFLKSASIKLGALALVFLASTGIANAGETKWGDYYATVSAYPQAQASCMRKYLNLPLLSPKMR